MPQSFIRRGIVIVLTMSGVALLDKSGWAPLGAGEDETHPYLIGGIGVAMLFLRPAGLGLLRRGVGMPMFGSPTVAEIEGERRRTTPGGLTATPAPPWRGCGSPDGPVDSMWAACPDERSPSHP